MDNLTNLGEPITIKKPPVNPSEFEKFKNDGEYFLKMSRWLTYNWYNTYSMPVTAGVMDSMVMEMIDNAKFYFGYQTNSLFNFMQTTYGGGDIPAIWINGQDISQFLKNMQGNVIAMVKPMGKNISAESISKDAVVKKKEIFDKIATAAEVNGLLSDMQIPVPYSPAGTLNYEDKTEVEDAKKKIRKQFEKIGTTLTRNIYYTNNCQTQFVESAMSQFINNLSGTYVFERNGQVINELIPSYARVFDWTSNGQFGENRMFDGFVVPQTYDQIINDYPNMPKEWRDEMIKVASYTTSQFTSWSNYWNQPYTNFLWWYPNQGFISKSVMFWLEKKDLRIQSKKTPYGKTRVREIDDYKSYPQTDATGKVTDSKMGYEVKGDKETWMVHYAVVAGNKYLLEYGYEPYQVRPAFSKDKPELPIQSFCHDKMAGMVRSLVSRLKPNQIELDRLAYKIQSLTGQDLGKVFYIRGDKFTETISPRALLDDAKQFKIVVIPPTGDEGSDKLGIKDMVHAVDMSNNEYIMQYLQLRQEQRQTMMNICSVSPNSLGQLVRNTGKAVNEAQIDQSSLGVQGIYSGLQEHWRRTLQYSTNKFKLVLAQSPEKVHVLPVSDKDVEVIKVTKDYRFEDLFVYIEENSTIEITHKAVLNQLLLAYGQGSANPQAAAQAMLNSLKLMKYQTFDEGIEMLSDHLEELKKEQTQSQQQQMLIEQQQMTTQQQSNQILQQQAEISEIYKILLKENLHGSWVVKNTEAKTMATGEDEIVIGDAIKTQVSLDPTKQQAQGQPQ